MAKRKRTQPSASASQPKQSGENFPNGYQSDPPFLTLPLEIRELIYGLCAAGDIVHLTPESKGQLYSASALMCVNRQVRQEYQRTMIFKAVIQVHVTNFDYEHVIEFLDNLSIAQLKSVTPNDNHSSFYWLKINNIVLERRIHFQHYLTLACSSSPAGLGRWLRRMSRPCEKGVLIDAPYQIDVKVPADKDADADAGFADFWELYSKIIKILETCAYLIEKYEENDSRSFWELEKTISCLYQAKAIMDAA